MRKYLIFLMSIVFVTSGLKLMSVNPKLSISIWHNQSPEGRDSRPTVSLRLKFDRWSKDSEFNKKLFDYIDSLKDFKVHPFSRINLNKNSSENSSHLKNPT